MYLGDMQERALRIAGARAKYGNEDPRTLAEIAAARAAIRDALRQATLWQRAWQARVSPNPLRGNHHDSWEAREDYVRANATFRRSIAAAYAESVRLSAGYPERWHRRVCCGSATPCARCVR